MIGDLMSCHLLFFPKLQTLSVNTTNEKHVVHPVIFTPTRSQCVIVEERLLVKAAEMRESLMRVTYGLHSWTRIPHSWPPQWQLHVEQAWDGADVYGITRPIAILYRLGTPDTAISWSTYFAMKEDPATII